MYENRFLKEFPEAHEKIVSWITYAKLLNITIELHLHNQSDEVGFMINGIYVEIAIFTYEDKPSCIILQAVAPPEKRGENAHFKYDCTKEGIERFLIKMEEYIERI